MIRFCPQREQRLVLLILLVATLPAFAGTDADRNEVIRVDEELRQAFLQHDAAALNRLLADDWKVVVRVFGDAALYTARIIDTGKHANGESFSVASCVIKVFVRRNGKWQIVAEHESLVQK